MKYRVFIDKRRDKIEVAVVSVAKSLKDKALRFTRVLTCGVGYAKAKSHRTSLMCCMSDTYDPLWISLEPPTVRTRNKVYLLTRKTNPRNSDYMIKFTAS
jgi:hypothetical protein